MSNMSNMSNPSNISKSLRDFFLHNNLLDFFPPRGCMTYFFGPRGYFFFLAKEVARIFFGQRGSKNFFCPTGCMNFFLAREVA